MSDSCPFLGLLDPKTYVSGLPIAHLRQMREEHGPVVLCKDSQSGESYFAVLGREEIDAISRNPRTFSSQEASPWPMHGRHEFSVASHTMISLDPPFHGVFRRAANRAFAQNILSLQEEFMRVLARSLTERMMERDRCEFIEDFAAPFALSVLLELFGVPQCDHEKFSHWLRELPSSRTAVGSIADYAGSLAEKPTESQSEAMRALLEETTSSEALGLAAIGQTFLLILHLGTQFMQAALANGVQILLENPSQVSLLQARSELIPGAVEEVFRCRPPVIAMRRTVLRDWSIHDTELRAGDKLVLFYAAVGSDASIFGSDSHAFDVTRACRIDLTHAHRAFGIGEHFCLGHHMARMMMHIVIEELLPHLQHLRQVEEVLFRASCTIHALTHLPLAVSKK